MLLRPEARVARLEAFAILGALELLNQLCDRGCAEAKEERGLKVLTLGREVVGQGARVRLPTAPIL